MTWESSDSAVDEAMSNLPVQLPAEQARALEPHVCRRCGVREVPQPGTCRPCQSLYTRLIPEKYYGVRLNKIERVDGNAAALDLALKYRDVPHGLLIIGPNGHGKSHLAHAIVRELWLQRARVTTITVPRLLRRIKSSMKGNGEQEIIEEMMVEHLLLDDLCSLNPTDYSVGVLTEIIDERYNRGLNKIIVTTDMPLVADTGPSINALSPRIASRLVEMCYVTTWKTKNWRLAKGPNAKVVDGKIIEKEEVR